MRFDHRIDHLLVLSNARKRNRIHLSSISTFYVSAMASLTTPMFASVVESSVIDSTVSVSGPLAGMFGAPTSEPLIDSQIDAEANNGKG